MQPLKTIRKQKYSYAKDFLPILAEHGVKYSIPEYSLFESGRALPTKTNAVTICKCLGCGMGDVEEFIVFGATERREPTDKEKSEMIKQAFSRFGTLPTANPKRGFRMNDENWNKLQGHIHAQGFGSLSNFLYREVICKNYSIAKR